jgi:hypothetical protein
MNNQSPRKKLLPRPVDAETLARIRGGDAGPVGDPEYKYVTVRR